MRASTGSLFIFDMLDIHTHVPGNPQSVLNVSYRTDMALTRCHIVDFQLPEMYSFGIHPWDVRAETLEEELSFLYEAVESKNPCFIGECGIDKVCDVPLDIQILAFKKQVILAQEKGLPLIVHCVRAASEVASVLRHANFQNVVVIHGVRCGLKQISPLVSLGERMNMFFSFGANFHEETLRFFYPNQLLVESDEGDINESYVSIRNVLGEGVDRTVAENWLKIQQFHKFPKI